MSKHEILLTIGWRTKLHQYLSCTDETRDFRTTSTDIQYIWFCSSRGTYQQNQSQWTQIYNETKRKYHQPCEYTPDHPVSPSEKYIIH